MILSPDRRRVLLCKRKGEADYDGTYTFIGGKLEKGDETLIAGIAREKTEEIGADARVKVVQNYPVSLLFTKKDGSQMVIPHHYAEFVGGEIILNDDEYSDYRWVEIEKLSGFEPKVPNIPVMVEMLTRLKPVLEEQDFILI